MNKNILFVCNNHKGRSPAFHALAEKYLLDKKITGVKINSAGIDHSKIEQLRREGSDRPSRMTRQILKEREIDIENYRLVYLAEMPLKPYLVLAVDKDVLESVKEKFPYYSGFSMLASDYALCRRFPEICGPYHPSRGKIANEALRYRIMVDEISYVSEKIADRIGRELAHS